MLTFKQFLKLLEHLTDDERKTLQTKKYDTSVGEQLFRGIMPEGQTHLEIPIDSPLESRVRKHLISKPLLDKDKNPIGLWKWDGKSDYAQHPVYKNRQQSVSSIIQTDKDLLKDYNAARSVAGDKSREGIDDGDLSLGDYKIVISRHPFAIYGKSSKLKPWHSCAEPETGKNASKHLIHDINEGGAVAYLVHKDEPNPNDPERAIGRISLNPFVSERGHIILRAAPNKFGTDDNQARFYTTVSDWAKTNFPMDNDSNFYTLNKKVYQRDTKNKKLSNANKMTKEFNWLFERGRIEAKDIAHAAKNDYANSVIDKNVAKRLSENNDPKMNAELVKLHISGHDIGKDAIYNIIRHRTSTKAHSLLSDHHIAGNYVGDDVIENILQNTKSTLVKHNIKRHREFIKEFSHKFANGLVTDRDLIDMREKGYSKSIMTPIIGETLAKKSILHQELVNILSNGGNIGKNAIEQIVKSNPVDNSYLVIRKLINLHNKGKINLNKDLLKIIANIKSADVHEALTSSLSQGKKLPIEAITSIANNLASNDSHYHIIDDYNSRRKEIPSHIIEIIANNPNSTLAHVSIVKHHNNVKNVEPHIIETIANNPNSTSSHEVLAIDHTYNNKILNQHIIDAICKHQLSDKAHYHLASSFRKGFDIGQHNIDAIASNPNSSWAHQALAMAHAEGRHIGNYAIKSIMENPTSNDAHRILNNIT